MRSLSSSIRSRFSPDLRASVGAADRRGELAGRSAGRASRRLAVREAVEHLLEALGGQILVGVVPDQHHRRVHAGAEALDLFPREIAVGRDVERLGMDAALADLDQRRPRRAACTASCRTPARAPSCRPAAAGTWCRRSRPRARGCWPCRASRRRTRSPSAAASRPAPARATAAGSPPTAGGLPDICAISFSAQARVLRREGELLRLELRRSRDGGSAH